MITRPLWRSARVLAYTRCRPGSIGRFMRCSQSFRRVAASVRPWRTRGFTLLELLVVMVIIGLLAGYVAPRYFSQVGKSEVKVARAQIDALETAVETYRFDVGRYPTTEQGLEALMKAPSGVPKWQGPYLKKALPPDPWGNAYLYKQPGEHGDFDISSWGRDGRPGGTAEDADLGNWQ